MPHNISTLHGKAILRHDRTVPQNLHGWFLHLWRFIRSVSLPSWTCPLTMCWKEFDTKRGKCHFMIKHRIILRHEISRKGIEVNKAKIDVIAKLPKSKHAKDIWSFLGNAGFYCRFIKDFSKIAKPLTNLLVKKVPFTFDNWCFIAWEKLKKELISVPNILTPD